LKANYRSAILDNFTELDFRILEAGGHPRFLDFYEQTTGRKTHTGEAADVYSSAARRVVADFEQFVQTPECVAYAQELRDSVVFPWHL
jgi:hypothetical protein